VIGREEPGEEMEKRKYRLMKSAHKHETSTCRHIRVWIGELSTLKEKLVREKRLA
jgi:hypothetical protein